MLTKKMKKAWKSVQNGGYAVVHGDSLKKLRFIPSNSVDAIVTDPPYGIEFMGAEWDSPRWMDGAGADKKTGLGYRPTGWVSFGSDSTNPTCASCGGRKRGNRQCDCDTPDWRVRGKAHNPDGVKAAQGRSFQKWCESWCREALRVLKPGGHIVAFGGTRMWHRLASAIEDAGFEIRDTLMFMHGQGFPKSMNVGKAIDATIKVGGSHSRHLKRVEQEGGGKPYKLRQTNNGIMGESVIADRKVFSASTTEARRWEGWGTALKPATEPVVLARKPLTQTTVAKQVLKTGTGALNIDGCRVAGNVAAERGETWANSGKGKSRAWHGTEYRETKTAGERTSPLGRWPANVVLQHSEGCECVGTREVKIGTAVQRNGGGQKIGGNGIYRGSKGGARPDQGFGAKGKEAVGKWRCTADCPVRLLDKQAEGVSRFYYTAKPRKKERNAGMPEGEENRHPTLKSMDLMRWLCRLVTPKGGLVLDPFVGSGTTVCAAGLEGFRAIGIERDKVFARTAYHRASHWLRGHE